MTSKYDGMKLKTFAIVLSILAAIEIAVLILSAEGISPTKISISKIGSLEGNYLFYLLSTSILITLFASFLHKIYETLGYSPKKVLYIIPILSIIALLFKAGFEPSLGKIIHTILFVMAGIMVLIVMYDLNNALSRKVRPDNRISFAPKIALLGTIGIFIIIGLNCITEIFYIGTIISWMHYVSAAVTSSV